MVSGASVLSPSQVLTFPNVGVTDIATLDPATGLDQNSMVVANMIYSGLVRTDKDLQVISDQATWHISSDAKIYTFMLKPNLTFSDGTPVTAQSYIYTWTRALLPVLNSPVALLLEFPIMGASDVNNGNTQTVSGLKALDDQILQVTLTRPSPYFLSSLTNPIFFPLNQKVVEQYGQEKWSQHVVGNGVGTGPLRVISWQHNVKMVFAPNDHYYSNKSHLKAVEMPFVDDPLVAFKASRAGQYDFVWGLDPQDQLAAKGLAGFVTAPLLQTDTLFFDRTKPPFDKVQVRQALAYATDKATLAHLSLHDTAVPAATILPPGMPGYQTQYTGLPFDAAKARSLLQSVYPNSSTLPSLTLSFPNSQMNATEATALQQMWQRALGIQVTIRPIEENAFNQELNEQAIAFGFMSWSANFPDPYACLALRLVSSVKQNGSQWRDAGFDQTIEQAETKTGNERLNLYQRAEQIAVSEAVWLPLDHQKLSAVIAPWVHGVTINGNGLYFGDWSNIYLLKH